MEKKGTLASQSTCLASHLLQTLPYVMLHRAALYEQKEIQTFSTVFVCIYVYMWMVLCVCLCGCVCVGKQSKTQRFIQSKEKAVGSRSQYDRRAVRHRSNDKAKHIYHIIGREMNWAGGFWTIDLPRYKIKLFYQSVGCYFFLLCF